MAKRLAQSLELHCPGISRAIVADDLDADLASLYHIHIPYRPELGTPMQQKLYLNDYTPFHETLYVDVDSLVVRDLSNLWELFQGLPFGVVGKQVTGGTWYGRDISDLRALYNLESIPRFNGGLLYLQCGDTTDRLMQTAREIMDGYGDLGLEPSVRGGPSDEPVLALALARHGIEAVDDGGSSMRTLIGIRGSLKIDVLKGYSRFNKEGEVVEPAIVHFPDWYTRGFFYKRECLKLELAHHRRLPADVVSPLVNVVCTTPYAAVAGFATPLWQYLRLAYQRRQEGTKRRLRS